MMDKNDNFKFIDDDSPQHFNYVWKKKKAVQKTKIKTNEEKDFRQICAESFKEDETSFEESFTESKTYFGKEGNSSGDDIPEIAEEDEEFSNNEMSLSPRAPLVMTEEDDQEDPNVNLEIVVSESDHERIALTTGLTVKDQEDVILKQAETEAETIIKYGGETESDKPEKVAEDVKPSLRVHFKDDPQENRKCNKKENVSPLTEEGLEIDLLFTEDVTIRVSFKEGKVIVEESEVGGEGKTGSQCDIGGGFVCSDSISRLNRKPSKDDTKDPLNVGDQGEKGVLESEILKEEENTPLQSQCMDTSFSWSEDEILTFSEQKESFVEGVDEIQDTSIDVILDSDSKKDDQEEESLQMQSTLELDDNSDTTIGKAHQLMLIQDSDFRLDSSVEKPADIIICEIQAKTTENRVIDEISKLQLELRDSEKHSTTENEDNLSTTVKQSLSDLDGNFESSYSESDAECEDSTINETHQTDNTSEHTFPCENLSYNFISKDNNNLFSLHDIIEEESCSDIDNEDYTSSDSAIFFEAADSFDSKDNETSKTLLSNDENLRNYSKAIESEDSSNSDSSLEKCEIESSEKEIFRHKSNPILDLLEMQKKEEIYETSLEILQEFRSNLIPGITSASNWISCCDSDELSLGVVGGGEGDRWDGGRWTALSTGGAERRTTSSAEMLSTLPPAPGRHGWQYRLPSDSDSDSLQGDSLDTVIQVGDRPVLVDRETQVDSQCERCESHVQEDGGAATSCDKEEPEEGLSVSTTVEDNSELVSLSLPCEVNESTDSLLSCDKYLEICIDNSHESISETENKTDKNSADEVKEGEKQISEDKELQSVDSQKVLLKDLFPIKRSTNALENLPLIFPHARGLSVTKPVNKFENLFFKSPFEKETSEKSGNESDLSKCASNQEKTEIKGLDEKSASLTDIDVCGRVDLKTDSLFQFNVTSYEGVTSFSEEVRDSSEDDMKQKKKHEDNRNQEEAVGASNSELCNGYHKGVLKSALKRSSTKKSKKKNRVQFDESLNKFFDADYVILIREEPEDFEGDYDIGGCDCGEDFCYDDCCDEDDDEEEESFQEPPSPRFDMCAAFEPPVEFVDQVTLSPPDGYKDTSHYCPHHQPRPPTKRIPDGKEDWMQAEVPGEDHSPAETRTEATNTDDELNQGSSDQGLELSIGQKLTQQQQRYIVETITMTTVTERRIVREADGQRHRKDSEVEDNKLSGILKGGKLWKSADSGNQTDLDDYPRKGEDVTQVTGDEDDRRGVRFSESGVKSEAKDSLVDGGEKIQDGPEMNLGFKVGNATLSTAKPNSAVRQLFPSQRFMSPPPLLTRSPDTENAQEDKDQGKYLVTAENLKMFEDAKKSKLQQYYSSRANSKDGSSQTVSSPQQEQPPSDDDEGLSSSLIKRTIERNTLRRSLLKYPHDIRLKRNQNKLKNENSLVERIKQLTCDVDDEADGKGKEGENMTRTSPPGEESQRVHGSNHNRPDKIASSGMSSTYKKLTDLFSRRDKLEAAHPSVILQTPISVERQYAYYQPVYHQQTTPPDLGNGLNTPPGVNPKHLVHQRNSVTTEARKQFLSSLAPLTACVSGNLDDSPGSRENHPLPGDRTSVASTSTAQDSEYSLDDIEEVLNSDENKSQPQPDVVAGTPAGNSEQDELALFVQQDAGRIERIRKRYSATPNSGGSDDDEHDDYGFNRRPSVRGIKPRFGSTTEILQQMQSQLQPPPLACPSRVGSHITWPYYTPDDSRRNNPNRAGMPILKEETHFTYIPDPNLEYATNSPVDPTRTYQHQMIYSSSGNLHQPMRIGGGGDIQYPARVHHIHTDSPPRVPPMGMMVPFQEHDFPYRTTAPIYARRAIPGSVVQMRVSPIPAGSAVRLPLHPQYVEPEPHYSTQPLPPGTTSIIRVGQQQTIRVPYPTGGPVQVHLLATRRSESPQRGSPSQPSGFPPNQYVVARGTQTSSISSTYYNIGNTVPPRGTYYPSPPLPQSNGPNYNRGPLIYSEHPPKPPHLYNNNNYPSNPHRATSPIQSLTSSPTRMKPQNERGVPEGAASSSPAFPQDSVYQLQVSSGTNIPSPASEPCHPPTTCDSATSPVSPPQPTTASPVYYSMNV